jgi:hypothetical protein
MTEEFNAKLEVEKLKKQTFDIKKPRYRCSKLDKYTDNLVQMHRHGASVTELHRWLRKVKKQSVAWSTVYRWVKRNA